MKRLLLITLLLTIGPTHANGGLVYPEIHTDKRNIPGAELVTFKVFNRLRLKVQNQLPDSVSTFTKNLIVASFFSDPCSYSDGFCGMEFPQDIGEFEFYIVYEPSQSRDTACKDVWWYYLRADPAAGGKSAAIAQYLISQEGEILYGEDVSPYQWENWDCPIAKHEHTK